MVEIVRHIECYCRYMVVRMRLLDEFELKMSSLSSYFTSHTVIIDVIGTEHRSSITWTERLELLEDTQELRCDLREVQHRIYIDHRCLHLRNYCSRYVLLDSFAEYRQVLLFESKTGSIKVTSEVLQQIGTAFDSIIEVKTMNASCRTGNKSSLGFGKHNRRLIECFDKTRSHDSYDSFVPFRIIYDSGLAA